jgi:hypothetical protein
MEKAEDRRLNEKAQVKRLTRRGGDKILNHQGRATTVRGKVFIHQVPRDTKKILKSHSADMGGGEGFGPRITRKNRESHERELALPVETGVW